MESQRITKIITMHHLVSLEICTKFYAKLYLWGSSDIRIFNYLLAESGEIICML